MRFRLLLAALTALACSKQAPPGAGSTAAKPSVSAIASAAPVALTALPQSEITWTYPDTPIGPMSAVVVLPERQPDERFPILLTFHGMGEARKGPEKGARGWIDDYGL